jgi:methylenetetrahydrofolate dehydrogenase (NADP+) / methenyltetrahydrofolate cyclohydrolase
MALPSNSQPRARCAQMRSASGRTRQASGLCSPEMAAVRSADSIGKFASVARRHYKSLTLTNQPKLIDGRAVAEKVYSELRGEIEALKAGGLTPGLAVVLVGEDPASRAYVRSKDKMCRELGLHSVKLELPAETKQSELLALVEEFNRDPAIHGILVQSPPPKEIDEAAIIRALDPAKDVDGFHPVNIAKLALGDPSGFVPCTPLGCLRLLRESGVEIKGAHVVVLGRSMIVGKPLALLLMQKGVDATVTVVHSRTRNLPAITRSADVVIAAIGRAAFVRAEHVREGAVVIDVGINRVDDAAAPRGYRLAGDVAFDEVAPRTAAITPVPGGVGPMTIAMLMANTVKAARLSSSKSGATTSR